MSSALSLTSSDSTPATGTGKKPPVLSRNWPVIGHLLELRSRPIELFARAYGLTD